MLFGNLAEPDEFPEGGVEHQHVDAAGLFLARVNDFVEILKLRYVRLDRRRGRPDFGGRLFEFRLAAPGDKHARAFLCEAFGRSESNSAAAAGDDGYLYF